MKFSVKDFLSKCDQIHSFQRIWSHLLKKSFMKNVIFCEGLGLLLVLEHCRAFAVSFSKKFTFISVDSIVDFENVLAYGIVQDCRTLEISASLHLQSQ